ncbi:hypothetical protein UA08_06218 [Talaromyces atroroseus]|uniref:DRBM domain-containing protein n=1 Tax=Talaromyces atroroseus TaxID=1441469 RepID=A0A225AJI0_TALAT|nr:hypothetical protein UA08_06218 [Talaromyces atroroseus]OKL58414.1 hypothetical protein UA08_06218 [Talaromyces atroroseus]
MSISHRPSMFFPISDCQDELPGRRFADDHDVETAAEPLSPIRERGNPPNAVIRLVPGPRPFTFVSQESNFNAFSSSSSYYSPHHSSYPCYPSYPSYYPAATHPPTFIKDARDVSQVRSSHVAVEDAAHQSLASTRYDAHYQKENHYPHLEEIRGGKGKHEEREVRPRYDDLDDDDGDDDATVVVEVGDEDDEERQVVRGPPLDEVDTRNLTSEQVLFYFGVLKLQEKKNLNQNIQYNQEPDGRWSARFTMYNDSLKLPSMRSLVVAKVEICRVALSILKVRHARWRVPDEPSLDLTAQDWRWFSLLQEYVKEMGLSLPESSRYVHRMGFRYEIAVGSVTGLGKRKFYTSEDLAIAAAAHQVLYLLITGELRELSGVSVSEPEVANGLTVSPGTPAPRNGVPASSPTVKRAPNAPRALRNTIPNASQQAKSKQTSNNNNNNKPKTGPVANAANKVTKPPAAMSKRARARMRKAKKPRTDFMSNLRPVVNPRMSMEPVYPVSEPVRIWKESPGSLSCEIVNLATYREKFDKLCSMLGLKHSLETRPYKPGSIFLPPRIFTVWVTIENDPFLARAGPIGKVEAFRGTQAEAQEACSKAAVEYVMGLVREDYAKELAERVHREQIEGFPLMSINRARILSIVFRFVYLSKYTITIIHPNTYVRTVRPDPSKNYEHEIRGINMRDK